MAISSSSQEPRWRRLPEERPQQIIDAALTVFGERGLACARLEDIAWAGVAAAAEAATLGVRLANKAIEAFRGTSERR